MLVGTDRQECLKRHSTDSSGVIESHRVGIVTSNRITPHVKTHQCTPSRATSGAAPLKYTAHLNARTAHRTTSRQPTTGPRQHALVQLRRHQRRCSPNKDVATVAVSMPSQWSSTQRGRLAKGAEAPPLGVPEDLNSNEAPVRETGSRL